MVACSISGCKRRSGKNVEVTFHSIPKDESIRQLWIAAIGRGNHWSPSIYSKVCSLHFDPDDFDKTGALSRLKKETVPSKNLLLKIIDISKAPAVTCAVQVDVKQKYEKRIALLTAKLSASRQKNFRQSQKISMLKTIIQKLQEQIINGVTEKI